MARNEYSEIDRHIVWYTKGKLSLLGGKVEPRDHEWLCRWGVLTEESFVHEIRGTANHVHRCVSTRKRIT